MPFYDNFSLNKPSALGMHLANQEAKNIFNKVKTHKNRGTSILEIGPGRGPFMRATQANHLDYSCVDISWPLLQDLSGAKRVCAMVPPLPIAKNTFDIVFASNVLEHMSNFNIALTLVQEMTRIAKPEGLVCHRVPNAMSWGLHFWNGDYTHSFFTTPRTDSQVYLDAGLKIEQIYPVSGSVIGNLAHLVSFLGKLVPSFLINHGAGSSVKLSKMLYSAKTTFLLGFLIVGRKVNSR